MIPKTVVIVGGGFAGLNAAKRLGNSKNVNVILVDRRNYHLFQPLLYQVATAALSPADIAEPIRSILSRYKNIRVILDNVTGIDLQNKRALTPTESIAYDFLILACGAKHSYFAHPEWETFAPGLKTVEQATEIRRRILMAFELAEREEDAEKQKALQTFVIVGAGPTGVEIAGAISEISRTTLERDFRRIDPTQTRVILIEAGPRILASFSEKLAKRAARDLERLGVQIWTGSKVTLINADGVVLGDQRLRAATVIWAAGVQPSSLGKSLGVPMDSVGRVKIQTDLSIQEIPDIFVLGDQSVLLNADGKPLPGLAPVAMQQGRQAAVNIELSIQGKPRQAFHYLDKGQMATLGRRRAIVQTRRFQFGGVVAWYAWLLVHVWYLIGFKKRIFVLLQWAWSYLTFRRGARLIVDKEWRISDSMAENSYWLGRYFNSSHAEPDVAYSKKYSGDSARDKTTMP